MRFLVTGGCGFIGAKLVEQLVADRHDVLVLDDLSTGSAAALPPGVSLLKERVEDGGPAIARMGPLDGIFHLAAVSSVEAAEREPARAQRVNVAGTAGVLRAARTTGGRPSPVVMTSSAAVYGQTVMQPACEDQPAQPCGIYSATKLAAEQGAAEAFSAHGVPSVAVRLFNVYGPASAAQQPPAGVIAEFCRRAARGDSVPVHGDGRQQRDFLHVRDAVALLSRAMTTILRTPDHLAVNGCTGRGTSLLELASQLSRLSFHPLAWHHLPARPGDLRYSVGDPSRAAARLRFHADIRLESGLPEVFAACIGAARGLQPADS